MLGLTLSGQVFIEAVDTHVAGHCFEAELFLVEVDGHSQSPFRMVQMQSRFVRALVQKRYFLYHMWEFIFRASQPSWIALFLWLMWNPHTCGMSCIKFTS